MFSWAAGTAGGGRVVAGKGSVCRRKQSSAVGKFHQTTIDSTIMATYKLAVVLNCCYKIVQCVNIN